MSPAELVSLIVVTYNSKSNILKCIDSILKLDYSNFELIIVDNCSTDGTRQILAENEIKQSVRTKIILNSSNLGYNLGNMEGIRSTNGEIIAIINPDVILEKNWLRNIVNYLNNDSSRVIVSGTLLNSDKTIQTTGGFLDIYGAVSQRKLNEKQEFFYHSGAAFVFRKKILEKINLDPNLFMYYDDVDLAWQARLLGYSIDFCNDASAIHNEDDIQKKMHVSKFYNIAKNRMYVCAKNYSLNRRVKRTTKIFFFILADSVYYSIKFRSAKYLFGFLKAIVWNVTNFKLIKHERKKIQSIRKISDDEIEKSMIKKSIELEVLRT